MECDPITYAPTAVVWVRQFEDPDNIRAYEIEPGTCSLGGLSGIEIFKGDPEPSSRW